MGCMSGKCLSSIVINHPEKKKKKLYTVIVDHTECDDSSTYCQNATPIIYFVEKSEHTLLQTQ